MLDLREVDLTVYPLPASSISSAWCGISTELGNDHGILDRKSSALDQCTDFHMFRLARSCVFSPQVQENVSGYASAASTMVFRESKNVRYKRSISLQPCIHDRVL